MAFNAQRSIGSNRGNPNSNDDSWKADRFINIRLKAKDGTAPKIATAFLKLSNKRHNSLIEYLDAGGDEELRAKRLAIVLKNLVIDYQSSEPKDVAAFDLED